MNDGGENPSGPVLLYDGECGLCNRVVRLLLRLDRHGRLRFASLQGSAGQAFLRLHGLPETAFSTLILVPDWNRSGAPGHLVRTAGIAAALKACGGVGRFVGAAVEILPAALGDAAYRFVSRIRYRLFGPWKARPLPKREWGKRLID